MDQACAFLAGAGLGAGLMYVFDPDMGRRRRALARDQAVHLAHEAQDAAGVVARDVSNRAKGLASGDLSVLAGGKRALQNPLRGGWSPSGRALMGLLGGGLCAYGMTRDAPTACVLGAIGLALVAEAATNVGLSDVARASRQAADVACDAAGRAAEGLGLGGREGAEQRQPAQSMPTGSAV
jgi:hypothetical protein